MAIATDAELAAAVTRASELLQEIQDYVGRQYNAAAQLRFPRGFLRTASHHRGRLNFVEDDALRANLSYTLMLSDVVLWLLWRTDLTGTAKEMLTKLYIFIGGTLVESITKEYLRGICGQNYSRRLEYLVAARVITEELKTDLVWLWDMRNNMHLFQLEEREYENQYTSQSHGRAAMAYRSLVEALRQHGRLHA